MWLPYSSGTLSIVSVAFRWAQMARVWRFHILRRSPLFGRAAASTYVVDESLAQVLIHNDTPSLCFQFGHRPSSCFQFGHRPSLAFRFGHSHSHHTCSSSEQRPLRSFAVSCMREDDTFLYIAHWQVVELKIKMKWVIPKWLIIWCINVHNDHNKK